MLTPHAHFHVWPSYFSIKMDMLQVLKREKNIQDLDAHSMEPKLLKLGLLTETNY